MTDINRRHTLKLIGAAPAAAVLFTWTAEEAAAAAEQSQQARAQATATRQAYKPRFFTAHEYATVVVLGDLIIPKHDDRRIFVRGEEARFVCLPRRRRTNMRRSSCWAT